MAQLLWRINIEGFSCFGVNILHQKTLFLFHFSLHQSPFSLVRGNARLFHGCQHRHQRLFYLAEKGKHAVFFQFLHRLFIK